MYLYILSKTLSLINKHERDDNLKFEESTHKYTILSEVKNTFTSVTTWNHSHFSHFNADEIIEKMMKGKNWNPQNKYWGKTPEQIKEMWAENAKSVSEAGTDLHFDIECFMNMQSNEKEVTARYTHKDLLDKYNNEIEKGKLPPNTSDEWGFFLQFVNAFPNLKPYRTEWCIYNEDVRLAGSIDMVYENPDGTLSIYDWKRAKEITKASKFNSYAITECINHLPDTNFWHYSFQLNTYKAILESKYNKKVKGLYLVRLHPNNPKKTFEIIKCVDLTDELYMLFELRKKEISDKLK